MDIVIFDGIRTPFGKYGGALAFTRPDDLLAQCLGHLVKAYPQIKPHIEDVIIGDTNQAGEDSRNIARNAALLADLAIETGGMTVNRLCGSGMAAVLDAYRMAKNNEGDFFIAGGVESMSRAPLVMSKSESPFSSVPKIEDSAIGWRFANKNLLDKIGQDSLVETAENIARDLDISKENADEFAYQSQQKYQKALEQGFYIDEILPTQLKTNQRKTPFSVVSCDEHPRLNTKLEKLASLKPLIDNGTVTAGNASGINDGAAALLLGLKEKGEAFGLKARARIIGSAIAGVEPRVMGLGAAPAAQKALQRSGLTISDMDVIEVNEAFSAQVLGCLKLLRVSFDDPRVNPNGGAIAIGHPLGASGTRLILTALRQLELSKKKYALVTMCIGIGQGIACVIERCDQ
ncbi:MAG: acetyl-CoA C-acyltransferase [Vibrio hibernica]